MAAHEWLLTNYRRCKWGVGASLICFGCDRDDETSYHSKLTLAEKMREKEEREGVRATRDGGEGATKGNKFESQGKLSDPARRGGHCLDKVTTSFFVTNFPDEVSNTDLWKLFINFGRVGEVFIPKKLDKWGRRFAFVKFWEVLFVEELAESLKDVWCGDHKLKVNMARFEREDKKVMIQSQSQPRRKVPEQRIVEAGTSFRGALLGDRRSGKEGDNSDELPALEILSEPELLEELERCFVGRLTQHMEAEAVQTSLFMEGWRNIKVVPMGEKLVLLKGNRKEDVTKTLEVNKAWWKATFSEVLPWTPNLVASSRRVWVHIRGIPLHVWHEKNFKKVGGLFGTFLDFDDETVCRRRLDVANILISTKRMGRIDQWVSFKVMRALFKAWMVERAMIFEEGEDSMEEDYDLSKDMEEVLAEEDEEGRPEVAREEEEMFSGEDSGEEEGTVRSVHPGSEEVTFHLGQT